MFRSLERLQVPIALAVALLLPAAVYRAQVREPGSANLLDQTLLALSAPIQRLLVNTVGSISDFWHTYLDIVDARKAEAGLRRALGREQRRRLALEALELENEHLRALLELEEENHAHELVAARVVGESLDSGVEVLRIDQGALSGLQRGFPVLSGQGLVGRVLDVAWTSAHVQLIADARVSVSAKVLRTGARGQLRGSGQDEHFGLVLSEVLRSDDVKVGDQVVTSGLGGIYPPGIPIGVVTRLFTKEGISHRFAMVVPFADFARLEFIEVLVREEPGVPLVTPEPLLPPALRARPDTDTKSTPELGDEWPPRPISSADAGITE